MTCGDVFAPNHTIEDHNSGNELSSTRTYVTDPGFCFTTLLIEETMTCLLNDTTHQTYWSYINNVEGWCVHGNRKFPETFLINIFFVIRQLVERNKIIDILGTPYIYSLKNVFRFKNDKTFGQHHFIDRSLIQFHSFVCPVL